MKTKKLITYSHRSIFTFLTLILLHFSNSGFAQKPLTEWAKQIAGKSAEIAQDMVADDSNNIYVVGDFADSVDFDPGPGVYKLKTLKPSGTRNAFAAKYGPSGNLIWAHKLASPNFSIAYEVGRDDSGYIYIGGTFKLKTDFDPGPDTFFLTPNYDSTDEDIFIVKYKPDGSFVWAINFGGPKYDVIYGMDVDGTGNVYSTGVMEDSTEADPGPAKFVVKAAGDNWDVFVSKINSKGEFVWAKNFGGKEADVGTDIGVDKAGNVYTIGYFSEDSVDFDPGAGIAKLDAVGSPIAQSVFVSKLNASGNYVWAKKIRALTPINSISEPTGIAIDDSCNIYISGLFSDSADFDPGTAKYRMDAVFLDSYVCKWDSSGALTWVKSFGGTNIDGIRDICLDDSGDVYISGIFYDSSYFTASPTLRVYAKGSTDAFIGKLKKNGEAQWAISLGGILGDDGRCIDVDNLGNIFCGGFFTDTVDLDPGPGIVKANPINAAYDMFLLKLNQSTKRWYVDSAATGLNNGTSWANAFTKFEDGVDTASAGHEVWVANGAYIPPASGSSFTLKSGVKVYGGFAGVESNLEDRNPIINISLLKGNGASVMRNYNVDSTAILDGFTISNGTATGTTPLNNGGGIYNSSSSLVLNNIIFTNNAAYSGAGMFDSFSNPKLTNVIFHNNTAQFSGGGLHNELSHPILNNVVFTGNNTTALTSYGGAVYNTGSNPKLINVSLNKNSAITAGGAIYSTSSSAPIITNCVFWGNRKGAISSDIEHASSPSTTTYSFTQTSLTGTGNILGSTVPFLDTLNPIGPDGKWRTIDDGMQLKSGSAPVDAGTSSGAVTSDITGIARPVAAAYDMGAYEAQTLCRLYVDSSVAISGTGASWASPLKTVTEALSFANTLTCANEIWVKKGTYFPTTTGNRDSSFRILRNGIKIYGGFAGTETTLSTRSVVANPTILSGDINTSSDSTDNSRHVMTIISTGGKTIDTTTTVDGFTIRNGNANGGSFTLGTLITIINGDGGGILNIANGSGSICNPLIQNCTFTRNYANVGGAFYSRGSGGTSNPTFRYCNFIQNSASDVGGLHAYSDGGGFSIPKVYYSVFKNNKANIGAAFGAYSVSGGSASPEYFNSIFEGNNASNTGGAAYVYGGSINATNCVFVDNLNSGGSGGGAIGVGGGQTANLMSCTFSNNTTASTSNPNSNTILSSGTLNLTNTIIWGTAANQVVSTGTSTYSYSLVKGLGLSSPSLSLDPNFANPTNPIGPDNIWLTADDGLELKPCSPAVNAGTTAPVKDIRDRSRVGIPDMGAYEEQGAPLAVAPVTDTLIRYCKGDVSVVLSATKASTTDTLKWYDASLILLSAAPTPSTTDTGTLIYYVSQKTITGCESEKKKLTVRVNDKPSTPIVSSPISYCQGASSSALTAVGTDTLKWYNSSLVLLSSAPTPSTTSTGSTTYFVSSKNNSGCESGKASLVVTVNPTPAATTTTTSITYCQGVTATLLTATKATVTDTLRWYNASMVLLSGAPTPSTTLVGTTDYYVSAKSSLNCEGPKTKITVTVNPTPSLPTSTTPIIYCQGQPSAVLTATSTPAGDTIKWYDNVPTLLSGAPTPSTTSSGTTIYYVSQKNGFACESAKKSITVTVNPTPAAPTSASTVTYCQNDIASALTATKASSSDTLKWYNSSLTLLSGAPIPSTTISGTTIYYVSSKTALGCEGPKTTITVQVNPQPSAPSVTTPLNLCVGITAAPLAATGINLKWYNTATGGTSTSSITPSISTPSSSTFYVSQTSALGCESPRSALTVNVNPSPVITLSTVRAKSFVYCVGDSITIKANAPTAISYQWYKNSVILTGSNRDTLSVKNTDTFNVIVKNIFGCADTESVYVFENNLPKPKLSPEGIQMCEGVIIMLYSSPSTPGYKYEWFKDGIDMGVDTTDFKTPVSLNGAYLVRVTDIYGCVLTTNISTVSKYPAMPKPTIVNVGSTLRLTATYASYQWYRNGKIITGATSNNYTPSFDGNYTVEVKDINGCEAVSDIFSMQKLSVNNLVTKNQDVKIYPNPTKDIVRIEAVEKVNLKVTDITGKLIMNIENASEINLQDYADGIYIFHITNSEGKVLLIQKVLKKY